MEPGAASPARRQRLAYGYAWLTVACWASVATAFKLALRELDPPQLLLIANAVAVLVLGALVLVSAPRRATLRRLPSGAHRRALLLGVMNPLAYYLLLFHAYDTLPAQVVQPVNYTWAIALSLLAVPLLGQRLGTAELLAAALAYAGVVVISLGLPSHGGALHPGGLAAVLASTVIWALYWIVNSRAGVDPLCGVLLNFGYALPFTLGACLWFSRLPLPSAGALAAAAWVGVFEMGVTFVFWQKALLLSVNAARVSNLVFVTPVLSLAGITLVLGEALAPTTLPGLALILGGLLVQQRFART